MGVGLPPLTAHERRVQDGGSPKDNRGCCAQKGDFVPSVNVFVESTHYVPGLCSEDHEGKPLPSWNVQPSLGAETK